MTFKELCNLVRAACADILHILPGLGMDRLEEMDWPELSGWRDRATDVWKRTHGVSDG